MSSKEEPLAYEYGKPNLCTLLPSVTTECTPVRPALPTCINNQKWHALHTNAVVHRYMRESRELGNQERYASVQTSVGQRVHRKAVFIDEIMADCTVNSIVPVRLLQFWKSKLNAFYRFIQEEPTEPGMENIRAETSVTEFLSHVLATVALMEGNIQTALRGSCPTFKSSTEKTNLDKAFQPINLQLQSLVVLKENFPVVEHMPQFRYNVTTVGAFTGYHSRNSTCLDSLPGLCTLWSTEATRLPGPMVDYRRTSRVEGSDEQFVPYPAALRMFKLILDIADTCLSPSVVNPCYNSVAQTEDRKAKLRRLLEQVIKEIDDRFHQSEELQDFAVLLRSALYDESRWTHPWSLDPGPGSWPSRIRRPLMSLLLMDIQDWNPPYPVNFPGDMIRMYTRECLVMSQMITATIACIMNAIYTTDLLSKRNTLNSIKTNGLLVYYESLLSCWEEEKVMLEDIVAGMDLLARIKFTVCVGESWELVNTNQQISVESPTGGEMEIFLPRMPSTTKFGYNGEGFSFRVYPVFLNVGVNEKASLTERSNEIEFQHDINKFHGKRLLQFSQYAACIDSAMLSTARADFARELSMHTQKQFSLLQRAEKLTEALGGLRVTMCKSAKDRTAMAVTLEQMSHVQDHVEFTESEWKAMLDDMRK
ncbi:hypothetical protein RvY_09605-2 [Ramazzottius varieornatus]|nr:hypothetical protein RvY_09605-2 [Ramazzottius varieornatus]